MIMANYATAFLRVSLIVIPAASNSRMAGQAGIHVDLHYVSKSTMDSGFRRNDGLENSSP